MSVESLVIALHHSRARGTAKLVLLGIANHDGDGGAWPSVYTLQRYAGGIDKRNVQRALDQLEQLGEIRRLVGAGGNHETAEHRRPNLYRFLLRCPYDCDRTSAHRTKNRYETVELDLDEQLELALSTGVALSPPGGAGAGGGGGAGATLTNLLTEPVKTEALTSPTAHARDEAVPTADEWHSLIDRAHGGRGLMPAPLTPLQRCPARTLGPCAIHPRTHVCMDCLSAAVPWAQPGSTAAEDDRRADA